MGVLESILNVLLPLLVSVLVPVLSYFVARALQTFRAKTGMQLSAEVEFALDKAIKDGVLAAEQWALALVKQGGEKPSGLRKLDEALSFVDAEVKRLGLPELARDVLVSKIEAEVFDRLNS